ncbi:MAG: hypothetical protein AAFN11_12880, partial [Chloroflexota bacterium]
VVCGALPTFFFVYLGTLALEDSNLLLLIYGLVAALILLPVLLRKQIERLFDWASGQDSDEKAKRQPDTEIE